MSEILISPIIIPQTDKEAQPGVPHHWAEPHNTSVVAKPATHHHGSPPATKRVSFSDPLVSDLLCKPGAVEYTSRKSFFPTLRRSFFTSRDDFRPAGLWPSLRNQEKLSICPGKVFVPHCAGVFAHPGTTSDPLVSALLCKTRSSRVYTPVKFLSHLARVF
jgi:hypothetical protein